MCICVSIQTHTCISVTAGRNFLMLGITMDYGVELMPVVLKMLILSGIPDTQTKMFLSEKDCCVIRIGNLNTAANGVPQVPIIKGGDNWMNGSVLLCQGESFGLFYMKNTTEHLSLT